MAQKVLEKGRVLEYKNRNEKKSEIEKSIDLKYET